MVCYEEAISISPTDLSAHEGLMKCYLNLGNWYLALSHTAANTGNEDNTLLTVKLNSYKVSRPYSVHTFQNCRSTK